MIFWCVLCFLLGLMLGAVGMAVICFIEVNKFMNEEMDDDYEYL